MDGVSSVLFCAVSGKGLKGVSTFEMSLWAVYRLGGPDLKNYEATNLEFCQHLATSFLLRLYCISNYFK